MNAELTKIKKNEYNTEEYVIVPPVDIFETENEFVIKAEIPGVMKDGVEVTVHNNELEINGKVNGNFPDKDNLRYSEFNLYNYHRKFNVGDSINNDAMTASLENGILTITLPKKEEVKPRKIEIKTGQ